MDNTFDSLLLINEVKRKGVFDFTLARHSGIRQIKETTVSFPNKTALADLDDFGGIELASQVTNHLVIAKTLKWVLLGDLKVLPCVWGKVTDNLDKILKLACIGNPFLSYFSVLDYLRIIHNEPNAATIEDWLDFFEIKYDDESTPSRDMAVLLRYSHAQNTGVRHIELLKKPSFVMPDRVGLGAFLSTECASVAVSNIIQLLKAD